MSAPDKKESENLEVIAKEIKENLLTSRAYFYFNLYLDLDVKDDVTGISENELKRDHEGGS